MRKIKAGFVVFGEVNTPGDIIERKCREAKKSLEKINIDFIYTNPVSDDPAGKDTQRAIKDLSKENFDFLVVCIAGWIPSPAVITVINEFKHKPMLLWGLAGYTERNKLISTADQAGTTALRKVMEDMGFNFKFIYNCPGSSTPIDKIENFAKAARAVELLKHSKIGMMGFRDMNLYATLFDGVSLRGQIGPEVEIFEMFEIARRMEKLNRDEVMKNVKDIKKKWIFEKPADDKTLEKGVKLYSAIRDKTIERGYQAVSLMDIDGMKKLMQFPPAMIFMLLADELNVCTIPENDTLGSVTQLITKYITGQIAAYFEFYEFMKDRVLIGVPDFVPSEVVDGPVKVTSANFGELSGGVLNISKVKTGKVTLCRLTNKGDRYSMHIVTGEAVEPGPWEEAGWTPPAPQLPSLEVILDIPVEEFAEKVLSQHYIISYGDNSEAFKDLCRILKIEIIQ